MTQLVHSLPRTHDTRRILLAMVLAAAATLAAVGLLHGDHPARAHVYTAPGHAYAIAYPRDWSVQRGAVPVLRSPDRRAMIVVRPAATPASAPLSKLAAGLTAELKRRLPDFRPVGARVAPTRGGAAFLYTFARTRARLVQSVMVARVRGRAYSLYAVAPAGAPALARQTGAILGTFGQ